MDGGWEVYPSFCEILVVGFLSRLRCANFSKGAEGYSWQSQIRRESMGGRTQYCTLIPLFLPKPASVRHFSALPERVP